MTTMLRPTRGRTIALMATASCRKGLQPWTRHQRRRPRRFGAQGQWPKMEAVPVGSRATSVLAAEAREGAVLLNQHVHFPQLPLHQGFGISADERARAMTVRVSIQRNCCLLIQEGLVDIHTLHVICQIQ